MPSYSGIHETAGGTALPIIALWGSASVLAKMHFLAIGTDSTPADAMQQYQVGRITSAGTGGTAITPALLNPVGAAAAATCKGGTFTGSPTPEANNVLLNLALNQRSVFQWFAYPGRELLNKLAADNGLQLLCVSSSTGTPNIVTTIHWEE